MFIPEGNKVYIKVNDESITDKELILESEVSLGISSTYEPLLNLDFGAQDALIRQIAANFSPLQDLGVTGQIRQQGYQVWKETKPLELKLAVGLYMKTNGALDVMEPAKRIMKLPVPRIAENGVSLIPPGPNVVDLLLETAQEFGIEVDQNELENSILTEGGGIISIRVGEYLNLPACIVTSVVPSFSNTLDEQGNPVYCKLDIDVTTIDIANTTMIDNLTLRGTV